MQILTPVEAPLHYRFSCTVCGDCCSGNTAIPLNLYDLYKIVIFCSYAESLELFSRKLIKLVQGEHDVLTPVMHFKGKRFKFCPFLSNTADETGNWQSSCTLHPHYKPLVCKMAPLGRIIDLEAGTCDYTLISPSRDCPGMNSGEIQHREDLKRVYDWELAYEYRYYRLLETIKHRKYGMRQMLRFFTFKAAVCFDAVINQLENRVQQSC